MNSLENVKNQINNMITNPTSITYGCLGISTALLGYYTFIKSSDEKGSDPESVPVPVTEPEPEPEPEPAPAPALAANVDGVASGCPSHTAPTTAATHHTAAR